MRRLTALLVVILVVALAVPAGADTCGTVYGIAHLQASGSGTGAGQAIVAYNGHVQVVPFTSELDSSGNPDQVWEFDEGTVEVHETSVLIPIRGPWYRIDSTVVVQSPNSGSWRYRGVWNQNTLRANFVVTGDLCVAD